MACICGNKQTEIKTEIDTTTINNKTYQYETTYSYCPKCGEEWYTGEQLQQDSDIITALTCSVMGILLPQEVKAIREKHGLSIEEAADLFSCHVEQWKDFESGIQYQPRYLDKLLRIFDIAPDLIRHLKENEQNAPPPREVSSKRRQPEAL